MQLVKWAEASPVQGVLACGFPRMSTLRSVNTLWLLSTVSAVLSGATKETLARPVYCVMAVLPRFLRNASFCVALFTGAALAEPALTPPTVMMPDTPFPTSIQRLLARVQSAVVEIRDCPAVAVNPDCPPDIEIGSASGVLISASGEVLTVYHLIRKVTRLVVVTADGRQHPATVVGFDELLGLALLRFPGVSTSSVVLAPGLPDVGTQVLTLGFTAPQELTPRSRTVMMTRLFSEEPVVSASDLQVSVVIKRNGVEGGGPVFNLRGQLLGLLAAKHYTAKKVESTYAAPTVNSADLARLRSGARREIPVLGLSSSDAFWGADLPVTFFEGYGLGSVPGLIFTSTWAGGRAEKAGLKPSIPDAYDQNHKPTHATGGLCCLNWRHGRLRAGVA